MPAAWPSLWLQEHVRTLEAEATANVLLVVTASLRLAAHRQTNLQCSSQTAHVCLLQWLQAAATILLHA
jgi:hypothetical protein